MNMELREYNHSPMIPMYRTFVDDIFVRFIVIGENVLISFIKKSRGPTLRPPCDIIDA